MPAVDAPAPLAAASDLDALLRAGLALLAMPAEQRRAFLLDLAPDELEVAQQGLTVAIAHQEAEAEGIDLQTIEGSPELWLQTIFPSRFSRPFAAHQRALLAWAWAIRRGVRSRPRVDVWARGGGKSGVAEGLCCALGATGRRAYALYVSATQLGQADPHVANIAALLEAPMIRELYPQMGERALTQYGHSKGWKRNRLRTAAGFTVDALGLDTNVRGLRMEDERPDLVILDDIDDPLDSPAAVQRKIDIISLSILPLGSPSMTVLVIQNLVHENGVVAQILDGRAEMLADRIVCGPIPAIDGDYRIEETGDEERPWRIVGGEPTWEGQDRDACEEQLATFGPSAWESEAQHKRRRLRGGMYDDILKAGIAHCARHEVPDLVEKSIAVDPATVDSDASDCHGVQCDGLAANGTIYRLRSWEHRASPGQALRTAIEWAFQEGVLTIDVEMVGSDLSGRDVESSWRRVFAEVLSEVLADHPEWRSLGWTPNARKVRPSASTGSKAARSAQMHTDYERPGRIVHVLGDHQTLEDALSRAFVQKPFDLADAAYYSWRALRKSTGPARTASATLTSRRIDGG